MTEKPGKQVERPNFPSVDNQFKPGQSGNPAGPPKAKTQLWRFFCNYMDMTDIKFATLKKKRLTQAQQAAIKLVEDVKSGKYPRSARFAQYCIDRDRGKPKEHVEITGAAPLSDDECKRIRDILKQNANSN